MTEDKSVPPTPLKIDDELHTCPACGYEQGFHVSLVREGPRTLRIILICPNCAARYDVDWLEP